MMPTQARQLLSPEGQPPPVDIKIGDFILTHADNSFWSWLIRFGQRLRYRGDKKKFAYWNHAAGIISIGDTPMLMEMMAGGATLSPLSKYADRKFIHVSVAQEAARAQEAVDYWNWLLATKTGYGWVTIFLDAMALLLHLPIGGGYQGRPVCSASIAAGLGFNEWRSNPETVLPADLAYYFGV